MPYIGHSPEVAQRRYESVDDISGSFNGSTTSFALQVGGVTPAPFPVASENVLISVGGVIQEPDGGGTNGFQLTGTNIVFSSAPAAGQSFFGVILAGADYVTAGHAFPDGDLASPSVTFASDLDTGLFRPDSGALAFGGNGVERLRIDGSGNVGINQTPTRELSLHSPNNNNSFIHFTNDDTGETSSDGALVGIDGNEDLNINNQESSKNINFRTGGSERARIDSSGRLLVGTSSNTALGTDSYLSQIKTSGASAGLGIVRTANSVAPPFLSLAKSRNDGIVQSGDFLGKLQFIAHDGNDYNNVSALISAAVDGTPGSDDVPGRLTFHTTADGESSPTERLRITNGGKIQVTGTRAGTLQPSDNDSLELYTSATSGNVSTGGGITFYNNHGNGHVMGGVIHVVKANGVYENSSSDMLFGTRLHGSAVAYRARLTSAGEWQTFSTSINIDISNTQSSGNNEAFIYARYGSTSMTAGSLSFRVFTNGNVQNTNNSYSSISDQNLKENIVDATSQWDDIKALQVRKYNFREATGHQTHTQLGLIAQEVETVSPGLVETTAVREGETCEDADGNQLESIKSINYSVLYMKAVKALQEAQTRIETLETQNTAQQTTIDDLLARVTALEVA